MEIGSSFADLSSCIDPFHPHLHKNPKAPKALQELASVYPFFPCTTDVQEVEIQTDKYVKSRVKFMIIPHSPASVTLSHVLGCFTCTELPSSSTLPKEILLLQDPEAMVDPQMNVVLPSLDPTKNICFIGPSGVLNCIYLFHGFYFLLDLSSENGNGDLTSENLHYLKQPFAK